MSAVKWLIGLLIVVALVIVMSRELGQEPEDERAALIAADFAFAAETLARGGNGWADFFASDGVMFPRTGRVDGREAIRETMLSARCCPAGGLATTECETCLSILRRACSCGLPLRSTRHTSSTVTVGIPRPLPGMRLRLTGECVGGVS